MPERIELVQGNIVDQDVDAIVNAANSSLLGGGGVDGAIHRAAGPELLAACRKLGGCETSSAKITPGFRLKARHVIHAVGPVYSGQRGEAQLLRSAYEASMKLAIENGLQSIAFPSISTGAYRFPVDVAAPIALWTVRSNLLANPTMHATFVLFDAATLEAYRDALSRLLAAS